MQLIQPDIVAAGRGLSVGAAGFLVFVGLSLWAMGWRWHRFWVVFGVTLTAGLLGLGAGRAAGGHQVMVVGVLLAVSAGMLALELAKVISFATGGVAAWVATQAVFPQVQELWAIFLAGGLVGVVLYKLWTMLTTSLLGVLVTWHGLLLVAQEVSQSDLSSWVAAHAVALNGGVVAVTILGVFVQTRTEAPEEPATGEATSGGDPLADLARPHGPAAPHAAPPPVPWWKASFAKAA